MRALRSWLGPLGTLALAALPVPAGAQAVGSEFQINTHTTGNQRMTAFGRHTVAGDASGNFVVVWTDDYHHDGSGSGVFAQRYDSAGGTVGTEFRVNSFVVDHQTYPSVAAADNGDFVVVWSSFGQDGSANGVFGQRYDSTGLAQGDEFSVNSYTTSHQWFPSVASDASGNFVVAWVSHAQDGDLDGVFGRRYDNMGVAQGDEFRVNSYTTGNQTFPSVASDASGNFVVVWGSSTNQDGDDYGVFGQRYASGGGPLGDEFRVNSYTTSKQRAPSVASDASGTFVVVWLSYGQDGSGYGIFGQRYDSAGGTLGSEFRVNSFTTGHQDNPSVASDTSGNFLVVWASLGQDGDSGGVFGQRYDSDGVAQGDEFQVNSFTTGTQYHASVGAGGTNQFVVAWDSRYAYVGDDFDVFGQRFSFAAGDTTPPSVTVTSPNGGEHLFTGSSYSIQWTASDDTALSFFDVFVSVNAGNTFAPIAECQNVPGSATSCLWVAPGPASKRALVRVTAEDTSSNSASDNSDAVFTIVSGTPSIVVEKPNTNVKWKIGSLKTIKWTHNLGLSATFRIELDRGDDGTYEELIAAGAPATSAKKGKFDWTVTGPPSATARVRVSWTGSATVTDSSDATFRIRITP